MYPLIRRVATLLADLRVEGRRVGARPGEGPGGRRRRPGAFGLEALEGRALMAATQAAGVMNPAVIKDLAAEAYVWGLAPEFAQRFSTYNTIVGAPINALKYGTDPAAWNNSGTNAGDSSVLYVNGFLDFKESPALVLTVPPSRDHYYVVNYLDSYLNTIGSIGTRTTPSDEPTSYLLVGPDSPVAKHREVTIRGFRYRVMASDTDLNWMLIRVGANTLADASAPDSVTNVTEDVVQRFALNTLRQFQRNGHQPVYPADFATPAPTPEEEIEARPLQDTPTEAVRFFQQLGTSIRRNPIPSRLSGLSGSSLRRLPSWVVPQYGAKARYLAPSYGQRGILRSFAPIGLSRAGFRIPRNWGHEQLQALQEGFEAGQQGLNRFIEGISPDSSTNYWTILNTIIGTYPSNEVGYAFRSVIVLNGGSANIPADAVYPSLNTDQEGAPLDGNNTYSITFTPPESAGPALPAVGILPPLVEDGQGDPRGFWSISLYQPDPSEVAAPFISQASLLNTHYSKADSSVLAIDASADTLTVRAPSRGSLAASTPLIFGPGAETYGLTPGAVYFVADAPVETTDPATRETTYAFQISSQWLQELSPANVPIQDSGGPGAIVDLQPGSRAETLGFGVVKPVSQLGSEQLSAGQLALNADGSLTLWFGPTLPEGAPASNWIPTPSTAYFDGLYPGETVSTALQVILRMYYPTPGDAPPSILPGEGGASSLPESYIPPGLVQIG